MKIIIAGSRTFNNYELLELEVNKFIKENNKIYKDITIISGTASGADTIGEWFAINNHHGLLRIPAKWNLYGKSAGYKRNIEMSNQADACIVFWDGVSRGSKHMIDIAKEKGLSLKVIKF